MSRKIFIISGSRNPEGRTAKALEAVMEGAKAGGATSEMIFLNDFKLDHCRQCKMNGFGFCLDKGNCIIEDDFSGIVDRIREADLIVFGTPVYWGDLSESLKAFLDRVRRICLHENGRAGIEGKPAVGICVAGGGGGGAVHCCFLLEQILRKAQPPLRFDVIDMVPVRKQNLEAKIEQLKIMGQWLSSVSPDVS